MPKGFEINVFASNLDVIVNAEQAVHGAAQAQQRNQEQASIFQINWKWLLWYFALILKIW